MYLPRLVPRSIPLKNAAQCSNKTQIVEPPRNSLEHLKTRSLIQVEGADSSALLQGLITNDIHHMVPNKLSSLYAMFLNAKGRVMCDSLIYKMGQENSYIVECDAQICESLMRHLKMYKIKKDVDIALMDSYKVYALYDPRDAVFKDEQGTLPEVLPCVKEPLSNAANGKVVKDMHLFCDPRLNELGYRIIASKLEVIHDELQVGKVNPPSDGENYRWLRYNLGVGEGVIDIPPNVSFPLESNCDYMHGINFNKGCYLGQELTARTYHTGKTRKRLMPLFLRDKIEVTPAEPNLYGERQQLLGKLRGVQFDAGLALLRMHLVVDTELDVGGTKAVTKIPNWWPKHKECGMETQDQPAETSKSPLGTPSVQATEITEKKNFECSSCNLREEYEYFGADPPFTRRYKLNEDAYIIEDPFQPPKQGEFIILGAHCKDCAKSLCKDSQCSFYYDGTHCIACARNKKYSFPPGVQDKLNKVGY